MNNNTTLPVAEGLQHRMQDYIEIGFLSGTILLGVPLNLFVLTIVSSEFKKVPSKAFNQSKMGFLLLKLWLTCSDIMILVVNTTGRVGWLCTYEWKGGDAMCKIYQFLSLFSFYLSSNIMVCIALDRLQTILDPFHIRGDAVKKVKSWITMALMLAIVTSMPQLIVWTSYNVIPEVSGGWYQCTDIWLVCKHFECIGWLNPLLNHEKITFIYNITHLILVFWGPFIIVLVCYVIIFYKLTRGTINTPKPNSKNATTSLLGSQRSPVKRTSVSLSVYNSTTVENVNRIETPMNGFLSANDNLDIDLRQLNNNSPSLILNTNWRQQMQCTAFSRTLLIVIAYVLCWLPYNFYSLSKYIDDNIHQLIADKANILQFMIIINALINPLLYTLRLGRS